MRRATDLTDREEQAIVASRRGLTYKSIANKLGVSPGTVSIYVRHALDKERRRDSGTINELSARAFNGLKNNGMRDDATPADVYAMLPALRDGSRSTFPGSVKNFGKRSLDEVEAWLTSKGFDLPTEPGLSLREKIHRVPGLTNLERSYLLRLLDHARAQGEVFGQ